MSAEDTPRAPGEEVAFQAALLLGRLRALRVTSAAVPEAVLAAAAAAAAQTGRRVIRIVGAEDGTGVLVLGWDGETAPAAGLAVPSWRLGLPPVPTLVWAVCLRAAWPEPELAPFPGRVFKRAGILSLCSQLGADPDSVERALDRTLPDAHLIAADGLDLCLGPAVAALPPAVVEGLRRGHHVLPVLDEGACPSPPMRQRSALEVSGDVSQAPEASDHYVVRSAVATLETARKPLPRASLPVLADPAMRSLAERFLLPCGRHLLQTPDGNWITGSTDPVADALVEEEGGTLTDVERAVLALVLLHTVAIPRAQGRHRHSRWTGEPHTVTLTTLASNRKISKAAMSAALRRLRAAGMVAESTTGRYVPGPALDRLTEHRSGMLWEDLILVGRPDGHLAAAVRRRRGLASPLPRRDNSVGGPAETDRP
ncbi:hypothetical protein [Streptomyces sp. NBC_00827]|uniref:hypothetical protein n=1 Tax=Streptomyces sp. NBC_00827 TaxID=2903677 RepID=UPI0038631C2F|nr:hypothetical protein OG569_42800 [Streptomyces sp. NBC_00827]